MTKTELLADILKTDEFGTEALRKAKDRFQFLKSEDHLLTINDEVHLSPLGQMAVTTTIYHDPTLRGHNVWQITPSQFEQLQQEGKVPGEIWEGGYLPAHLALVLHSRTGVYAEALYQSLIEHQDEIGIEIKNSDRQGLLVINAGLEIDDSMPLGVRPVFLPGLTQVCAPRILTSIDDILNSEKDKPGFKMIKKRQDGRFDLGFYDAQDSGLPLPEEVFPVSESPRRFYLPKIEPANLGLASLGRAQYNEYRDWDFRFRTSSRDCVFPVASNKDLIEYLAAGLADNLFINPSDSRLYAATSSKISLYKLYIDAPLDSRVIMIVGEYQALK